LKEDFLEVFRRYIPKSEIELMKAELARRVMPGANSECRRQKGELSQNAGAQEPEGRRTV